MKPLRSIAEVVGTLVLGQGRSERATDLIQLHVLKDEPVPSGTAVRAGRAHHREGALRHLDRPGGEQLGDRLRIEHVVQGVVQRSKVRIDLLAQGARQVAQAFAGLNSWAREDDAVHLLRLQRLDRLRHREVGGCRLLIHDKDDDWAG